MLKLNTHDKLEDIRNRHFYDNYKIKLYFSLFFKKKILILIIHTTFLCK